MSLEIGILILGFLALLGDVITSRLLMPKLRIDGQRSKLYREEEREYGSDREKRPRVYQFAFQSDESKVLEWDKASARILLEVRGTGKFFPAESLIADPHSKVKSPLRGYVGPDEFPAEWVKDEKSVVVLAARVRPHKTWVFRCYVTRDVEEMAMTLQVPSKWPIRRFLMRVSSHLFWYSGQFLNEKRIVVRKNEDKTLTRGFLNTKAELGFRFLVLAVAGSFIYYYATKPFADRETGFKLPVEKLEALLVGAILFLMLLILYRLSVRESLPIAQGYQYGKALEIGSRRPRSE